MAVTLPPAEWTRREDILQLIAALDPAGEDCRYVGGAVRDTLLGEAAKDIDLATRLLPDDVTARLDAAGIRWIPTGIAHGTVTAVLPGGNVEITTLRHDVETDGRRATVAFAQEWREDAARRDFTINALYADPVTLEVTDYFGGLDDLAARRVRFIGDAETRIREDHLRILRYFRFHARFGSLPPDTESEGACARLAPMLKGLSRERVGWELQNLLALPDPAATVARMHELGVLQVILPEADEDGLARLARVIAAERGGGLAPDAILRLAALLPPDPTRADPIAARLRLSNAQRKRLALAAAAHDTSDLRRLAYAIGLEGARDAALLVGVDPTALSGWDVPRLPVSGGDIVAGGIGKGPMVARILRAVEAAWVGEGFPGETRARELLAAALAAHRTES